LTNDHLPTEHSTPVPVDHASVAASLFNQGFNCSTAVFAAFAPSYGLEPDLALRLAGAFGGGMARQGETCGAVSGALLVIGLRFGQTIPGDSTTKEHAYSVARAFIDRFVASCGTTKCRPLLGVDISTPEGRQLAHERNLFGSLCPRLVVTAVQLLEETLAAEV
jgi:C_GCAxxG_C_C family probable redox protein